jgi:hypothetical protein
MAAERWSWEQQIVEEGAACAYDGEYEIAASCWNLDPRDPQLWAKIEAKAQAILDQRAQADVERQRTAQIAQGPRWYYNSDKDRAAKEWGINPRIPADAFWPAVGRAAQRKLQAA